jgi:hypothetical protein
MNNKDIEKYNTALGEAWERLDEATALLDNKDRDAITTIKHLMVDIESLQR